MNKLATTTLAEQDAVLLHIGVGLAAAARKEDIVALTGLSDRKVRAAVQALRLRGYPIGSTVTDAGFFIISNDAEREATLGQLRSRYYALGRVIDALVESAA